jgi:hypothetical protein
VVRPESTESFWRALVECGRPEFQIERTTEARIRWPKGLRQIRLEGATMTLSRQNGGNWVLPFSYPVQGTTLAAPDAAYTVRTTVQRLVVEPTQTKS